MFAPEEATLRAIARNGLLEPNGLCKSKSAKGALSSVLTFTNEGELPQRAQLVVAFTKITAKMALHVLAYNLTRFMNVMGIQPLMAAIRALPKSKS